MKLAAILESTSDDINDNDKPNRELNLNITHYMWSKLYKAFIKSRIQDWIDHHEPNGITQDQYSPRTRSIQQKLINHKHLWAQIPEYALYYSQDIIHDRFPEGEAILATDISYKNAYDSLWHCNI